MASSSSEDEVLAYIFSLDDPEDWEREFLKLWGAAWVEVVGDPLPWEVERRRAREQWLATSPKGKLRPM